jgi:large subunit ribosomal protein L25
VVYGGGEVPVAFQVDARVLRNALAHAGAVVDLSIDGADASPVVLKELVHHPVTGFTVHLDLLRVRLDKAIEATVTLELTGEEDAPGVKEGGVLEHVTRELTIEALPNDIPDSLWHDVSQMQIGDTLTLEALVTPATVKLLDDPETVIATLTPPRLEVEEPDEIEIETAVIGEGAAAGSDSDASERDSGDGDAGPK